MAKFRLRDRLRYRFDATLAQGPSGLIAWLFLIAGVLAGIGATVITLTGTPGPNGARLNFTTLLWQGWQRSLNLNVGIGPVAYLLGTFIPTLGGLFIGGIFIGLLTGGLQQKIRNLRKGRSLVVEQGHTVILGWSQQIFQVVYELVRANENKPDACVVVLSEKDKIEMEDLLRDKVGAMGTTRLVCRTGNPIDLTDLALVNPSDARAIIILAPDTKDPDAQVIKTLLALTCQRDDDAGACPIVAELRAARNRGVAQLLGRKRIKVLLVDEVLARVTVQISRFVGLSMVYSELLGFDGDELYLKDEPRLIGKTFGEALFAYEDSCLVGLHRDGKTLFNPSMNETIGKNDRIIVLSKDDDTIVLSKSSPPAIDTAALCQPAVVEQTPVKTLLLGWNRRAPLIIKELDQYVAPGSVLSVVAELSDGASIIERAAKEVKNLTVSFRSGDTSDRTLLEKLEVHTYNHVITLGYSDKLGPQEADAITLIALLHLRDLAKQHGHSFSIVSEMLDSRNRELAEVARADDFIVGDKLISQLLAQLAENPDLDLDDLFDADGSELYLKPASHYVQPEQPIHFYTVVEAARQRGEVAIGYRLMRGDANKDSPTSAFGVRLNPKKSDKVTFAASDKIVVLAQS